jgi:hypothetical protein
MELCSARARLFRFFPVGRTFDLFHAYRKLAFLYRHDFFFASSGEFVGDLGVQRGGRPRNRWNLRHVESKDRCCCSELTP